MGPKLLTANMDDRELRYLSCTLCWDSKRQRILTDTVLLYYLLKLDSRPSSDSVKLLMPARPSTNLCGFGVVAISLLIPASDNV
jgi:hypothetical protein